MSSESAKDIDKKTDSDSVALEAEYVAGSRASHRLKAGVMLETKFV